MSGEGPGTSGFGTGTSGGLPRPAWILLALLSLTFFLVNVTSILMEVPAEDRTFDTWEPVLWEGSSMVALLLLAPLVWRGLQRFPIAPPWGRALLVHLALTLPFSLLHVGLMLLLRMAAYATLGESYGFFDRGVGQVLLYEWRKDVLSYALQLGLFWSYARLNAPRLGPPGPLEPTLKFRVPGGTVHLRPSTIRLVEAAGNYVEIDADGRRHLVRSTLAAVEASLGPGFVRVHRSRLVNSALIVSERPRPSGDVTLELADGTRLVASRRYRDRLPSATGRPVPALSQN